MCDFDPPIKNNYDPEFPLESDDECDHDNVKSSALGPFAASIETNDLEFHSDLDDIESPCINAGTSEPEPAPAPKVYTNLFCAKTYTPKDLYPTEPDPTCYPAWALAFYWPVYVANFRLNSLDETERNAQISTYFATKGLLSRMIYIREDEDDEFFKNHQRKSLLLDMLVYFTSQEDAERAIRCCHKTTYYGHKLNVFSGRVPNYFDPQRTVRFQIQKKHSVEWTETPAELGFQRRGCENIETIVKHSDGELIVEFGDVQTMNYAVMQQRMWIPTRLTGPVRKQRYLEQDFKIELMWKVQEDSSFMSMVPPEDVLQDLLRGKLPPVERDWENYTTPRDLPPTVRSRIDNNRLDRKRKLVEKGQKRRAEREAGIAPVGPKNPGKGMTKKRKNEVKQEVQAFLGIAQPQSQRRRPPRRQRMQETFSLKREEFLLKRSLLLNENPVLPRKRFASRVLPLSTRNQLFYNLLSLERQLGNLMAGLGDELECEFLENGLTAALKVANEVDIFPNFPTDLKYSDEHEPLDKLWPVYVGNFRVSDLHPKPRNQQIIDFFASKNFAVEMIYVGDNDPFYNSYLKHIKLLDMLVYFNSKEVADKVVTTYHSTIYRDSKLSVYPGREAVYYLTCRTVVLDLDPDPTVGEQSIERIVVNTPPDGLISVARLPDKAVFFFTKPNVRRAAIGNGLPVRMLRPSIPKQRFLESDVKDDLLRRILRDAEFLNDQPKADSLRKLFVVESWPSDPSGEVVWVGDFQKRKEINARIGRVVDEWLKLQ